MRKIIKSAITKDVNDYYSKEVMHKNRLRKVVLNELANKYEQSTRNIERYISRDNKTKFV